MTKQEIKKQVLKFNDWEFWFDRPFGAFILSLWQDSNTRQYMKRWAGLDAEWPAMLFQNGAWWRSQKVWDDFAAQLAENLKKGVTVHQVVKRCEKCHDQGLKKIKRLLKKEVGPIVKLKELYEILARVMTFIWPAHGFEHLYLKKLLQEVPKYMAGDAEKFIGDISYPSKKNAHVYFMEALASDQPLKLVQKRFAWIKARDGFSQGFSLEEMAAERGKNKKAGLGQKFVRPTIPPKLKALAQIAQDLVYFRTLRTDILYEFLYLARPIIKAVGEYFNIPFVELRNYSVHDLMAKKPKLYPKLVCCVSYGRAFAFLNEPLVKESYGQTKELKGAVAFRGVARGLAKIVKTAQEIGKVKEGDILVAPSTAPSYIMGMKKAAAFVTDEGGITSHTSIVAREMKKPCLIGTKIATKVFKDGDYVEVDANRGVVKILKR